MPRYLASLAPIVALFGVGTAQPAEAVPLKLEATSLTLQIAGLPPIQLFGSTLGLVASEGRGFPVTSQLVPAGGETYPGSMLGLPPLGTFPAGPAGISALRLTVTGNEAGRIELTEGGGARGTVPLRGSLAINVLQLLSAVVPLGVVGGGGVVSQSAIANLRLSAGEWVAAPASVFVAPLPTSFPYTTLTSISGADALSNTLRLIAPMAVAIEAANFPGFGTQTLSGVATLDLQVWGKLVLVPEPRGLPLVGLVAAALALGRRGRRGAS